MNKVKLSASAIVVSTAAILLSAAAFARTLPNGTNFPPAEQGKSSLGQNASGSPQTNLQRGSAGTRLQDVKLRACQARENGIKQRSTQLANLAKNMEDKFDAIAQRVEDYYTNIVVPSGKIVATYGSLVSNIQTQKTAVQGVLTKAQSDVSGFSCTSDNPKGAITQFNGDMRAVQSALKGYRTSVKNLIVAVHSVTGGENKNSSSSAGESHNPNTSSSGGNE